VTAAVGSWIETRSGVTDEPRVCASQRARPAVPI